MARIANYYLEMAEGMYPVIEIDAGREVEFVLNSGLRLVSARNEVRVAQEDREGDDQTE